MADLVTHPQEPGSSLAFESSPWIAADVSVEEPRRPPEPPLRLENEAHVIEVEEAESIRRAH